MEYDDSLEKSVYYIWKPQIKHETDRKLPTAHFQCESQVKLTQAKVQERLNQPFPVIFSEINKWVDSQDLQLAIQRKFENIETWEHIYRCTEDLWKNKENHLVLQSYKKSKRQQKDEILQFTWHWVEHLSNIEVHWLQKINHAFGEAPAVVTRQPTHENTKSTCSKSKYPKNNNPRI